MIKLILSFMMDNMSDTNIDTLIAEALNSSKITVITGLPGSGKSACLQKIMLLLRDRQPPVKILYINPEESRWTHITGYSELAASLKGFGIGSSALFIDNADRISGFEEALIPLAEETSLKIFISGKNSGLILKKVQKLSLREVQEIRIHPMDYHSFLKYRKTRHSITALHAFLCTGGLPRILAFPGADSLDYLEKCTDSILLNEIIEPVRVRDPRQYRSFLQAMTYYSGQAVSTRMICRWFEQRQMTVSPQTVLDFLTISEEANLLISIPVRNIAEKKNVQGSRVWYFADVGIRSVCGKYGVRKTGADEDENERNRALENAVFLLLVDCGFQVSRGRLETAKKNTSSQLTFLCHKNNIFTYLQFCASSFPDSTRYSLKNTLLGIQDGWEKILVDTDSLPVDGDGIRTVSFADLKAHLYLPLPPARREDIFDRLR